MGQRLNIEILKGEKLLANAYYHWGGYTSSSIELTKHLINNINNSNNIEIDVIYAIKLLESTKAGMTDEEISYFKNENKIDLKFKECSSRNEGIIAISPEGMNKTRYWEEARVSIDIENKKVKFKAIRLYNTPEQIQEWISDYEEDINNLPIYYINSFDFTFEEFYTFGNIVLEMIKNKSYEFTNESKTLICSFIE